MVNDFNSSSYLQLGTGYVRQSCTAGTFLGKVLIGLSSYGAGDFITRGHITFKICGMPSYGWAMVPKIVHHLQLLQLLKFDGHSPTMARVIAIYQKHMTT